MEKSVIIIGGGIAGLSTGCYAQMNGYRTRIFEMHDKPGGLCTAWERKGYTIDGCLHWLVGSAPGNAYYTYWQELGMLQGREVIDSEEFYRYEAPDGRVFTMYCDIDRLERHMLELAPEDAAYIKEVCGGMRKFTRFNLLQDKPPELMGFFDKMRMMAKIIPFMGLFRRWGALTTAELASGFTNPVIREACQLWGKDFAAMGLLMTVAWLNNKAAGYTVGGSLPLAQAVEKRYLGLGGSFSYKSRVEKILVKDDRATGIRLENGEEHTADIVISAADGRATIFDMLGGKYVDDTIRGYYDNLPIFTPITFVGLGIRRKFDDLPRLVSGVYIVFDQPVTIAGTEHEHLFVHVYNFDPTLAPEGGTAITIMINSDYDYWKDLQKDTARYKEEKEKTAQTVIGILDRRFPGLAKQVEMVDVSTPLTFERYTGNWKGCYEGWMITPKTLRLTMKKTLPGLDDFYMVGQWVSPGGGLPCGPLTGRHVVQLMCHNDKKRFVTSVP